VLFLDCLVDDGAAVLDWWPGFAEPVDSVPVDRGGDVAGVSLGRVVSVAIVRIVRYGGGGDLMCVVVVLELSGTGGDTAQVGCGEGEFPRLLVLVRGAVR